MSFDDEVGSQVPKAILKTMKRGGTTTSEGEARKKHRHSSSKKHRSKKHHSSKKRKKSHKKKKKHSRPEKIKKADGAVENRMDKGKKPASSEIKGGNKKKKLLDYELVQAYQTRSIGCSEMLLDAPLTPPEYFPDGNTKAHVTVYSLAQQNVTPRTFFLNYVGWVAHPKDKAPRAFYRRNMEGKITEQYGLFPKELARYVLLGPNCYKEIFELHNGDAVFEAMKPFSDHIKEYKTIPHDKIPSCMIETHNRKLSNGKVQEVTMYRIEARAVGIFFDKMTDGKAKFLPMPSSPGKGSSSGGGNNTKSSSARGSTMNAKSGRKRTKKIPIIAKPVVLTKKLKESMMKLVMGHAFNITEANQSDFCDDVFEESGIALNRTATMHTGLDGNEEGNESKARNLMMKMMKRGYALGPEGGGKYSIDPEEITLLFDSCLTHKNAVLYDEKASFNQKIVNGNDGDNAIQNCAEDVGFDEESETTQEFHTEDEDTDTLDSIEDSKEFSESATVSRRSIQEELKNLSDLDIEHVEEGSLRSGTKRKKDIAADGRKFSATLIEIESSDDGGDKESNSKRLKGQNSSSGSVVIARVPDTLVRHLREKGKKNMEQDPEETERVYSSSAFVYSMKYTSKLYKMYYCNDEDANYISSGELNADMAEARTSYIRAFQSMLIEHDISRAPIKVLINFDKLNRTLRKNLGDESDFSDEKCLSKAEQLVNEMIQSGLKNSSQKRKKKRTKYDTNGDDNGAISQKIFTDILYAIYYLVALPELVETAEVSEKSEDAQQSESSEEQHFNAVVSPFLSAVKVGESKQKLSGKKKGQRGLESRYCYFVGNKKSFVIRWMDAFFRHIFRNGLESSQMFESVQHAVSELNALQTSSESEARQNILDMFGPKSRLPMWRKYYGTVILFMRHLFPIHPEGRGFDISTSYVDQPLSEEPHISFNV